MKIKTGATLLLISALALFLLSAQPQEQITAQAELATATAVPPFTAIGGDQNGLTCTIPANSSTLVPGCHLNVLRDWQPPQQLTAVGSTPCRNGMAAGYPCRAVNLLAFMPLADIGGGSGNDIWGWTDPDTGKEYLLMGLTTGTSFIDITNPTAPLYLGHLPTASVNAVWRDMKVYQNHLYVVADFAGEHGMQIFDLTQLRAVANPPATFSSTGRYSQFGSAHNIVINEESGFAYAVGISSGTTQCSGGLHMIDLQNPAAPSFAGCFAADGYTHDAQCVIYQGPDSSYQGQEICFNANTDTLTLVDVTNKSAPVQLARKGYAGVGYTHQGWLTPDQRYFLLDDEGDESASDPKAKTYIWDVADLDNPQHIGTYIATEPAIDHNLYIHEGLVYQANYESGLRVLDMSDIANGNLAEVAYFDIYPSSNAPNYNGAWSSYPFFASGTIALSGIEQGLYLLQLDLPAYEIYLPVLSTS